MRRNDEVEPETFREHCEGPGVERKVPLDCVQELAVDVFQRVGLGGSHTPSSRGCAGRRDSCLRRWSRRG